MEAPLPETGGLAPPPQTSAPAPPGDVAAARAAASCVTVVVVVPNREHAAVELVLGVDETVGAVKARVREALGVAVGDQRLIYGGRILGDAQTLGATLRDLETPQTLHLVVGPGSPAPSPRARPAPAPPAPPPLPAADARAAPPRPARPARPAAAADLPGAAGAAVASLRCYHDASAALYDEALANGGWARPPAPGDAVAAEAAANGRVSIRADFDAAHLADVAAALRALGRAGPPRPAAPAPGPGGAAAGAARRLANHRVVLMLDLKLALKLAVAVALLGQDAGLGRACFLAGAAVVAFLFQTGLLALGLAALADRAAARGGGAAAPGDGAGEPSARAALRGALRGRVPADGGGRLADCGLVLATLVMSLVPVWHLQQARVVLRRPAAADDAADD